MKSFARVELYDEFGFQGAYVEEFEQLDITALVSELPLGGYVRVERVEMTQEDFDKLEEFEGF